MLTVQDLQDQRHAKARVNHETYKQLLRQVQNRVRARAENKFADLVWPVPPFVPGRPVYAPSHAARYVSEKLRRGGFEVSVASSEDVHVLYVSWSLQPKKKKKKKRAEAPQPAPPPSTAATAMQDATRSLEKLKARLAL